MLPPITIGIPFYNAENFLLDSIKSVFAQTHQDWELILIDDGSTDNSLRIAQSISDPRVRVYSDGQNKKLAARLNEIITLAKFDFVARMDADDLMSPNRISTLLKFLIENPEYDLVSCGTYSVNNSLELIGVRGESIINYTLEGLMNKSQRFLHAGLVAHRSWFEKNKYNEELIIGEDVELWRRTAKAGDFRAASIETPLYIYREEQNVTLRKLLTSYAVERRYTVNLIDGRLRKARRLAVSWLRSMAVILLDKLGRLDFLLNRRQSHAPDQRSLTEYREILDLVRNTLLPISKA